jgi:peptide/nickel transport system substrate-binding protein
MKHLFFGIAASTFFISCGGGGETKEEKNNGKNEVKIHELSDPTKLNPITASDEGASEINANLYQSLVTYDPNTYEKKPYLAKALPEIKVNADKSIDFTFELRDEAAWNDGTPITAADVDFSLKLIKNPFIDCAPLRAYFEKFNDVKIDSASPKKFTVHCGELYHIAESAISGITVLNPKVFDPKGIMKAFTVAQLSNPAIEKDAQAVKTLTDYAKFFNDSFNTNISVDAGSGPYQFEKWETFQRVVIKRKQNWWGDKVKGDTALFHAYPDKLVFETINDMNTAVVALKANEIDVMKRVSPRDFVQDLQANPEMQKKFYLFTPPFFAYEYIGINTKNKKFNDPKVRKAFGHLVDVNKIIDAVYYGLGERVASFVHPSKKEYYNTEIPLPDYNVEKAKQLLAEAGWKDSNGDGSVDKMINGEKVEMEIKVMFNNGNERRKKIAIYFLEAAKSAGVKVIIQPTEWSKMLEDLDKHDFELCIGGWGSSPFESDPKQVWHTSSYSNGGSNYLGFGNAESDAVIEKLRTTIDSKERAVYYKELQRLISESAPCIFLVAQKERIAISKKWSNVYASGISPGYDAAAFKLIQ